MFYLVGLPDSAVKESHQRIISALQVNGYRMPTSNIVINMAPADIRKEGAAYDLPLAIGMLGASEVIKPDKLSRYLLMGELSLDGSLQPIKGALPIGISLIPGVGEIVEAGEAGIEIRHFHKCTDVDVEVGVAVVPGSVLVQTGKAGEPQVIAIVRRDRKRFTSPIFTGLR